MNERVQLVLMGLSGLALALYPMYRLGKTTGIVENELYDFGAKYIIFREIWKFQMASMVLLMVLSCVVWALGNADQLGVLAGMILIVDALALGPWALGVKDGVRLSNRFSNQLQEIGPDVQPIQNDSPVS